jgi:TPP-dependent pyruvate/acetoin dehydrogenase alpha subunit
LLSEGATEEQLDALEAQTRARVDDAVQAALQSPYPDPASDRATQYSP